MTTTNAETQTRLGVTSARRWRPPGLQRASALYLLLFIFVLFSLTVRDTFLTTATFKIVLSDQVTIGLLALALLIPLSAGAFDLSVGGTLAFSLVIVSWLQGNTGLNGVVSCVIAIAACAAIGALNGFLVVKFHVNSFIATIGMGQVLSAASLYISNNRQIVGVFSDRFQSFGRSDPLGIPVVIYYLVALAIVVWYVMEFTGLGRHMFATGANPEAARLAGVRTDRLTWGSLVASASLAGVAGLVFAAKVSSFSNSFGPPLLFPAFAAVFFGATQFKNRPNVWGTLVAVYALAFGVKGLQLAFASGVFWITPLFNGLALIVAVALASHQRTLRIKERAPVAPNAATPRGAALDAPTEAPADC